MKDLQSKIRQFCEEHHLECSSEHRTLDLVSEVGEFSKEILKATSYGKTKVSATPAMEDELGDVLFSLITLANSLDVDLEAALEKALIKYRKRAERGGIGSENE